MRKADNLQPSCAVVTNPGNLNFLETRPVMGLIYLYLPLRYRIIVYTGSCLVCVLLSYAYLLYYVCIVFFFTLDAGLLATSQYSEGPATGHLDIGFSWFPCV